VQPCIYLRLKVRMSISCGFLEHSKVLSTIGVKLKIKDTYSNDFRPYFSHATAFLICNCVKRLRLFFSYRPLMQYVAPPDIHPGSFARKIRVWHSHGCYFDVKITYLIFHTPSLRLLHRIFRWLHSYNIRMWTPAKN